jgi:mRNA interferase MazF
VSFERGRFYWCQLPDDPKRRPILIISPNLRNELASDVVAIPVSSVLRLGPWHVKIGKSESGLPRDSVLECEQPSTIRKSRLSPTAIGGRLSRDRMAEVAAAIIRALELSL